MINYWIRNNAAWRIIKKVRVKLKNTVAIIIRMLKNMRSALNQFSCDVIKMRAGEAATKNFCIFRKK